MTPLETTLVISTIFNSIVNIILIILIIVMIVAITVLIKKLQTTADGVNEIVEKINDFFVNPVKTIKWFLSKKKSHDKKHNK
jgi:phage-related minor tail protein